MAGVNPITGKPGPAPSDARNGDRLQARQRVNVEVRSGHRPHPNELPCADCGHLWLRGQRRHEYDHHLGYDAEDHLNVEAVCTTCHAARDSVRKKQTHCYRGHQFTAANTIINGNGTRKCRECRREYDRGRRDAAWWRARREKKRQEHGRK